MSAGAQGANATKTMYVTSVPCQGNVAMELTRQNIPSRPTGRWSQGWGGENWGQSRLPERPRWTLMKGGRCGG